MDDFRFSDEADEDLTSIVQYGDANFGVLQSSRYLARLKRQCSLIAERPLMYKAMDDIQPGLRRCVCGAHSIYYRVDERGVEIVRILSRQDLARAFGG